MSIQEFTSYPAVQLIKAITTLENGTRPTGGVGLINIGVPSLGGEHISDDGGFNFENVKYIHEDFFSRMSRGIIQRHDVLIVKDGATTGKVAFVRENFPFELAAVNEHVYIIRTDVELLLPEYLFYFLYSNWGQAQIQREFHGGAIGGINQSFVDHLEIPLPTLPEQRRINSILRRAFSLSQWRKDAIEKSKILHGKLFEWHFGSGEPSGNENVVNLKSLLKTNLSSGYSPLTNEIPPGIPVFNLSALTAFGLDEHQLKYFPVDSYDGKGFDLLVDDLLISRSNTIEFVGRVGRYTGNPSLVIYPDTMIRIRVGDHVDSVYLEHFLRSPYMRAVITQLARGTSGSMKKISQSDINEFLIPMPIRPKREKFAESIEQLERLELLYKTAFEKNGQLVQSLMDRAFAGELTASWRETQKDEFQHAAVERDKTLEKIGKVTTTAMVSEGKATAEELEQLRQILGNFAVNLNQNQETIRQKGQEVTQVNQTAMASMAMLSENIIEPFFESLRLSIQIIPSQKMPIVDRDTVIRYIDSLPISQGRRAILEMLDITTLRVLKLAGTYPAYFTPADLETGEFGGITTLQAESSLHVLEALGFVRLVKIDGILRYHLIDETADYASKPASLSA